MTNTFKKEEEKLFDIIDSMNKFSGEDLDCCIDRFENQLSKVNQEDDLEHQVHVGEHPVNTEIKTHVPC